MEFLPDLVDKYLSLNYIIPALDGVIVTYIIQHLKKTPWVAVITNIRVLPLVVGVIGSLIAMLVNPILAKLGAVEPQGIAELINTAFAITATSSALTYNNLVKNKK